MEWLQTLDSIAVSVMTLYCHTAVNERFCEQHCCKCNDSILFTLYFYISLYIFTASQLQYQQDQLNKAAYSAAEIQDSTNCSRGNSVTTIKRVNGSQQATTVSLTACKWSAGLGGTQHVIGPTLILIGLGLSGL